MLRLLYLSTTRGNGGSDRYAVRLAAGMQKRGASVLFACRPRFFTEEICRAAEVPTYRLRIHNSGDLVAVANLIRLIQREDIHVVHVHARRDYVTAALAVSAVRAMRRNTAQRGPYLFLHMHLIRSLGCLPNLSGRFFENTADAVIAVSEASREYMERLHRLSPGFVRVLLNGIALEDYATPDAPRAAMWRRERRAEWGIPQTAPVIGMVGRLRRKGQERLIAAAPRLLARFPDLRFVLVGPDLHPGDRDTFTRMARESGIGDRVIVAGVRDDIPAVMASFDILAHLPTDEAFGLVLVEAMAAGLPVVATNVGGCREVVQDGVTGHLIPPDDADALCATLTALLEPGKGTTRREQLGAAGRCAAQCFSLDAQMEQLHALYSSLLYNDRLLVETVA